MRQGRTAGGIALGGFGRARGLDPATGLMLAVVLICCAIILSLLGAVLWLSFRFGGPGDPAAVYSLVNYVDVFSDGFTYRVIANTLGFSGVTLIVALIFGLPAAWLVERTNLPGKPVLFTLMTAGLLIPGFAEAMGWLFLLHPRIGLLNTLVMSVFGWKQPLFDITTILGMGWVQGLNLAPVAFIMTAAVFRAMDPALEEAAEMAGANGPSVGRRITLRLAWPGILAAGIYIFTIGFAAFDVPAIIGWSNRVFTFSTYLLVQLSPTGGAPEYGHVAALSTVVIALGLTLSWWYSRLQMQGHRYGVVTGKAYRPRLVTLGWRCWIAWLFLGTYFVLSKLVPILLLIWAALLPYFQLPTEAAFASLSLTNFKGLPWSLALDGALHTAILMVIVPSVTLAFCLAFSWIVLRTKIPKRAIFDTIAFLPHAVPNVVFGVGALLLALFVVQKVIPLYGTIWILALIFVVARLSYGTRITNNTLMQIHRDLEEAAFTAGVSPLMTILRVVVPLLAPALVYAWLWIALMCYRELTLAVLLTTRDNITLPVVVWSLASSGQMGKSAALVLVLLVVLAPLIALYWLIARKRTALINS